MKERKVERKWYFWLFGWGWKRWEILVGSTSFLSSPFKIQSLQIGVKIGVKYGKNIWTKLSLPLLTFLAFFFLLTFPFCANAGFFSFFFFFCYFFFFFLSLVLLGRGGFFFFSFSFLFIFYFFNFIIFLRKHFWMIFYAIFWNVHFHLYTIFKKKYIVLLFVLFKRDMMVNLYKSYFQSNQKVFHSSTFLPFQPNTNEEI